MLLPGWLVLVLCCCKLVNYINAMTFQRANGVKNIALVFFVKCLNINYICAGKECVCLQDNFECLN